MSDERRVFLTFRAKCNTLDSMNKPQVIVSFIVGILLIGIAFVYFIMPASALPDFFPGHKVGMAQHHFKHGIGSLFLGLASFAYGWFQSGKKSSLQEE